LLLLTGSLDATNPLENAVGVAAGFENAVLLEVKNAAHEALPVSAVQDLVVDWFHGDDVRERRIAVAPPRFVTVEVAVASVPQPGR